MEKKIDQIAAAFRAYMPAAKALTDIDPRVITGVTTSTEESGWIHLSCSLVEELANEVGAKPKVADGEIRFKYDGLTFWGYHRTRNKW